MKKIIIASLLALVTTSEFLLNNEPAQANHGRYYRYPQYRQRISYCYPVTQWHVDEDPSYHPQAYADGYRQGQHSSRKGNEYKPRTAGGEFGRGFDDGYYGREFKGQKNVVPNTVLPYTTTQCSWW